MLLPKVLMPAILAGVTAALVSYICDLHGLTNLVVSAGIGIVFGLVAVHSGYWD